MYDNIEDKLIDAAQKGEYSFKYHMPKSDDNNLYQTYQIYQMFYKILEKKGFKVNYTDTNCSTFVITISWRKNYSKE